MTSATDELRRLLDERGVKYRNYFNANKTWWSGRENVGWYAETRPSANGLYVMIEAVLTPAQAVAATLGPRNDSCNCTNGERTDLAAENAKLREQMERLVTLLRNDCDIDASWDGLRRFWSIGLTEGGCLMRDRACKAEAENAKLRELTSELLRELVKADRSRSHGWLFEAARELRIEVDG